MGCFFERSKKSKSKTEPKAPKGPKAKVLYVNPDCTVGQALIKDVRKRVLRDPRIRAKLKGK